MSNVNGPLIFVLACAAAAIVYGVVSIGWVLKKPTGNDRMREIAAAIQAGAQAYLNRQYLTIGIVGAVLFVLIWWALGGAHGRRLPGRRGAVRTYRLHRNERVGALERPHRRSRPHRLERCARRRVPRRGDHGDAGCRSRAARRRGLLRIPQRVGRLERSSDDHRSASHDRAARRARVRRLADLDLRASWRGHLHQRRRCRCRPRGQGRGRHPGGRSAQSGRDRRQRGRQRRRLRGNGGRPLRDLRGHDRRDDAAGRAVVPAAS